MVGAAFAIFGIALAHLVDTGSCSTNPADNLPACPKGTEWWILSIFGAVVSFLVGLGILASRGARGGSPPQAPAMPKPSPAAPPPVPAPPPLRPTAGDGEEADPLDRIEKLAELRDAGVLTDAEFQLQKAKLLSDI
jgi:hypothetical protein